MVVGFYRDYKCKQIYKRSLSKFIVNVTKLTFNDTKQVLEKLKYC